VAHGYVRIIPAEMDEPEAIRLTVAYARVSSHDQKSDLDRHVARIG